MEQPQQDHEIPDIPFNQETLFLKPYSENKVMRTIQNLKNKSVGGDDIHAFSLKLAAPYISVYYTFFKRKCPSQFKTAFIMPHYGSSLCVKQV